MPARDLAQPHLDAGRHHYARRDGVTFRLHLGADRGRGTADIGVVYEAQTVLDTLFGVHRDELVRFLIIRTGSRDEAEDLLHELWLRARQATAPVANGRAYLFRMAQNLVVDRLRERQRRARRERLWLEARGGDGPEPRDDGPNAEQDLLDREETALLASAMATLPEGARRVLQLHKVEGRPHAEVASILGISKSGVEKHMAVAMKYLRRAMRD